MRKRNIQVMLHLDSKEYQTLEKKVRKSGLSRETYIRHWPAPENLSANRERVLGTIS